MNMNWAGKQYTTTMSFNDVEGWTAIDLSVDDDTQKKSVARIVFWDAVGQFFIEIFAKELPLKVVEGLIHEAKRAIRIS